MGHHVYLMCDKAFVAGLFERKVKTNFFLNWIEKQVEK